MRDRKPNEKEELVEQVAAGGATNSDPSAPEREPFTTFEIDLNDY